MSNCIFGFPDWTQPSSLYTPVVTAHGVWTSGLPASNALDRRLTRVARSVDATSASTQLLLDLGVARTIGLFAVLIPNLTVSSVPVVRFIAGTTLGNNDTYDSGNLQAVPTGITIEDLTQPDGSRMNLWQVALPTAFSSRYPSVLISDTGNADGYVDVARVVIAGAYRPSRAIAAGAKSSLENDTVRTKTEGGATLYKPMPTSRVDTFSLANIPESEALTTIRRMQYRLGTSGPLFFVLDEADPYRYMRSYQGTLRQLGALEYPDSLLYNTIGFEVAEDL
jgi:hypothetical protein